MKIYSSTLTLFLLFSIPAFVACEEGEEPEDPNTGTGSLHAAFAEFDEDNTTIYLDGSDVVVETNGLPNHTTPYWGQGHPLYVDPTVATNMTPTVITDRADLSGTLRVSSNPELASSPTSTNLGPIGIAVSGAYIYNDQEGGGALSSAIVSLDYTGGHIGPDLYHYHLEPEAFSLDDENLVGILSDGFFIYGRRCNSTGTYPTDLDASGGHVHQTQHGEGAEYHYHIQNELYINEYYIIFPGDYQGTPSRIN
ncbi:MAG: YHYH protein [Bacteroidota bacterium]